MLVWIDLEMTGLDPKRHTIVEIATLITDDDLKILEEGPDLVIAATSDQLEAMDSVVQNMHTKSRVQGVRGHNTGCYSCR